MDFNCPVCLEVYKDPVVLSCSHSFCKACMQDWWTQKITQECPVCKRRSSKSDPPCNLVLKNLCEAFSQQLTLGQFSVQPPVQPSEQPVSLCPQHKEKLQLFCVDDQQLVCLVCRDSRAHHGHRFSPIDEVAQEYRGELRKSLESLKHRLKEYSEVRQVWNKTIKHIEEQGGHTERLIQRQFDQMSAFLQMEEQARIRALRREVDRKKSMMELRLADLRKEMSALSESISQTEKELRDQDITFLQNNSHRPVQQVPLQSLPQLHSGSLVDVAKHLGNLGFNIWNKMKEIVSFTPVVLDPNTANKYLVVSDDLCTTQSTGIGAVSADEIPWLPDNPERFIDYWTVVGAEGFTSGQHIWEVDVSNVGNWAVGVIDKSAPRIGDINSGYWEIWFRDNKYTAFAPPLIDKVLTIKHPPQRIRVDLDMNGGKISFSDAQTDTHMFTFFNTFTKTVYPFLNGDSVHSLTISASKFP